MIKNKYHKPNIFQMVVERTLSYNYIVLNTVSNITKGGYSIQTPISDIWHFSHKYIVFIYKNNAILWLVSNIGKGHI